jgi:hypothetical protein
MEGKEETYLLQAMRKISDRLYDEIQRVPLTEQQEILEAVAEVIDLVESDEDVTVYETESQRSNLIVSWIKWK